MKCPACRSTLTERVVGALTADVCDTGCGGVYLDRFELNDVDEAAEVEGEALVEWSEFEGRKQPDQDQRYACPRCQMIMMRSRFKPDIPVTIDTCPQCAGIWVDHGELASIRAAPGSDEDRRRQAQEFIWKAFEDIRKAHS